MGVVDRGEFGARPWEQVVWIDVEAVAADGGYGGTATSAGILLDMNGDPVLTGSPMVTQLSTTSSQTLYFIYEALLEYARRYETARSAATAAPPKII